MLSLTNAKVDIEAAKELIADELRSWEQQEYPVETIGVVVVEGRGIIQVGHV